MFALLLLLTTATTVFAEVQINAVPPNAPIIFNKLAGAHISYESYNMIYHVNVNEYFGLRSMINDTLNLANATCVKIPQDICTVAIEQLYHQLNQAIRDDVNLQTMRQKRGICNWCGTIQSFMYGTLDHAQGEIIVENINSNHNETFKLHNLMINQTSLFQAHLKTNKASMNKIQNALDTVTNILNQANNQISSNELTAKLRGKAQMLAQIASTAINEHFRLYTQITSALSDARRHRIPELIAPERLLADLKSVAASIKPTQRLPIDLTKEDPLHIFKYATITALLIDNQLLIQILIPIAESERYSLYRATPIPISTPNGHLIISAVTPHFLINADKTKFIELSQRDLDNGKMLSPSEFIYRPSSTTQLVTNNNCVWKILVENAVDASIQICDFRPFLHNDVLITLIENEKYYIESKNGTTIWEICDNFERQKTIIGGNIMTLDPNCYVKTSSHIIKPHRTFVFNQTEIQTLPLALSNTTMSQLSELAMKSFANVNFTEMPPIVIADNDEMQRQIDLTEEMVKSANHEFQWKNMTLTTSNLFDDFRFDAKTLAWITGGTASTLILVLATYSGWKFAVFGKILNNFGFSSKLSKHGDVIMRLPESPKQNNRKYPNTPHPKRTMNQDQSQNQIEIPIFEDEDHMNE